MCIKLKFVGERVKVKGKVIDRQAWSISSHIFINLLQIVPKITELIIHLNLCIKLKFVGESVKVKGKVIDGIFIGEHDQ